MLPEIRYKCDAFQGQFARQVHEGPDSPVHQKAPTFIFCHRLKDAIGALLALSCCCIYVFKAGEILRRVLGRAVIVNLEYIRSCAPACGDVGGLCQTCAAACKQSGVTSALDVADKPTMFRGAFGWWGGKLGPLRAAIRLVRPLAGIASCAY